MTRSTNQTSSKRIDIQWLRGIAVLSVIFYHIDTHLFPGGYLGVDVFFVISGFLITNIITQKLQEDRFNLASFYLRRIKRIGPALLAMLLVTTIVVIIFVPPVPFRSFIEHLPWASLQVSNFSLMKTGDYFDEAVENISIMHTWSLGVEEQFYLVWAPFLMLVGILYSKLVSPSKIISKKAWLIPFIIILTLGISYDILSQGRMEERVNFFSPINRIWEFAMGAVAVPIYSRTRQKLLSSPIKTPIICLLYLTLAATIWRGPQVIESNIWCKLIACFATFALILLPHAQSGKRIYSPLRYIGDISYSLYLWHWPILCLSPYITNSSDSNVNLIFSCISFTTLSILSYHLVEQRFLAQVKWDRFLGFRTTNLVSAFGIICAAGFVLKTEDDSSWRFPNNRSDLEVSYKPSASFEKQNNGDINLYLSKLGRAQVVLIGDSHARHIEPLVANWSQTNQFDFLSFHRNAFNFITPVDQQQEPLSLSNSEDARLSKKLQNTILKSNTIKYIFISQRTTLYLKDEICKNEYPIIAKSLIEGLTNQNIRVVLLGQPFEMPHQPKPGPTLGDIFLKRDWQENDMTTPADVLKLQNIEADTYNQLSKSPLVYHLDPKTIFTSIFDDRGRCRYDDSNHLNYYGAMDLQEALQKLLKQP